ncbi:MAG TPA: alpha/beta fold hydrolase [Myxococcota bacterium]
MKKIALLSTSVALSSVSMLSCVDLDSFVMNPKHCSVGYSDDDCEKKKLCSACDEVYPFAEFGLPADTATRHPIPLADGLTNDAWFFPSNGGPLAGTTIVFSHGNFGSLEHYLNRAGRLWQLGANVFAVDYRGFGQSEDTREASEPVFMDDADRAFDLVESVLAEHGLDPSQPIALYGYSAGALSATQMAIHAQDRICALVLEAPWPSADAFAADSSFIGVPGSFVATGTWDNVTKLRDHHKPYLQLHGDEDFTVRIELGREVFAAVDSGDKALVVVEGAAHGNYLGVASDPGVLRDVAAVLGDAYGETLRAFLRDRCR